MGLAHVDDKMTLRKRGRVVTMTVDFHNNVKVDTKMSQRINVSLYSINSFILPKKILFSYCDTIYLIFFLKSYVMMYS